MFVLCTALPLAHNVVFAIIVFCARWAAVHTPADHIFELELYAYYITQV